MKDVNKQREILTHFMAYCVPATEHWKGFLPHGSNVLQCLRSPDKVVDELLASFTIDELVSSGLARRYDTERCQLIPELVAGQLFIALRDETTAAPYDLLTAEGCLSGELPALAVLRDRETRTMLEKSQMTLLAAATIEDVLVLRACGLPATLASGFEALPLDDIGRLAVFGLQCDPSYREAALAQQAEEEDAATQPHRAEVDTENMGSAAPHGTWEVDDTTAEEDVSLMLVGWHPSQLTYATATAQKRVADYFLQLSQHLNLEVWELNWWQPQQAEFAALEFVVGRRSAATFGQMLQKLALEGGVSIARIGKPAPQQPGPPSDLAEAMAALDAYRQPPHHFFASPTGAEKTRAEFFRLLERDLLAPLRKQAMASGDPLERLQWMTLADLGQVFHSQSLKIREQRDPSQSSGTHPGDQLPVKELLAIVNSMNSTIKEMKQCSPRSRIIEAKLIEPKSTPRLPGCG